jgi:hypothetical protein
MCSHEIFRDCTKGPSFLFCVQIRTNCILLLSVMGSWHITQPGASMGESCVCGHRAMRSTLAWMASRRTRSGVGLCCGHSYLSAVSGV